MHQARFDSGDRHAKIAQHAPLSTLGRGWQGLLVLFWTGLFLTAAGGQSALDTAALFVAARQAEREGRPVDERTACQALVARAPGGRSEQACLQRLAWLDARTDPDGALTGLLALETARRAANPTVRRLSLGDLTGDPAVSQVVRAEAAAALSALLLQQGAVEAALAATSPWWPGDALPKETRRRLGRARVDALVAAGDSAGARAVEAALNLPGAMPVASLLRGRRRSAILNWSAALSVAWAVFALPLAVFGWTRACRPRPRPAGLWPILVLGCGGWVLASAWDATVAVPFAVLVAALVVVHLLAAGGALALAGRPALRGVFGISSAVATVAVALQVMRRGGMLGWVGL